MAKLVLSLNGALQGEYELDRERVVIGRKPDNDISIDSLAVSGKHAMIITILDDSFIEDLGSTNGTYINDKLIRKHALKNGDIATIGKHELKYVNEQAGDEEDEDEFDKTMIIKPPTAGVALETAQAAEKAVAEASSQPPPPSAGGAKAPPPPPAVMPLGSITVISGPIAGKELELNKALLTLGRPDGQVAVISRRPQGYFLTHIRSDGDGKRYPLVNDKPIGPKAYALKNGDLIELTGIKMEFNLKE